jgi:hypothetical protein
MKHCFSLVYELDAPIALAVAAYLDAEHYIFLHSRYTDRYEVLHHDPEKRIITVRQSWKLFGLRIGQVYTCEYVPPARFKNYATQPSPWFMPSIHHLISVTTDLKYTPNPEKDCTISTLEVDIEMPFWLYPFRFSLQKAIEKLKIEKDQEDIEMMARRAKLFGRNNNTVYLQEHQFMLYKDDYVKHYGQPAQDLSLT